MSGRVVIGVGNVYRGDDGVGLSVASLVRGRVPADVAVLECEQEPTRLLDAWEGADVAVVVDACAAGGPPGSVHRFDVSSDPLPARGFRSSTHAFGVGDAVELSRALRPAADATSSSTASRGSRFDTGAPMSAPVQAAAEQVAAAIVRELETEQRDA